MVAKRARGTAAEPPPPSPAPPRVTGNLADLAATGIASEPTLRKWIASQPDQDWILKRGSNGDAYEIDIAGAIAAFQAQEEEKAQAARERADQIRQMALDLGVGSGAVGQSAVELSIAERRQLLEEELVAIKLSRARGELVSYASACAAFGDVLVKIRQRGRTFAARLAKKVDLTRDQIAAIDRLVDSDHGEMAALFERLEDDLRGDGSEDAGAGAPAAVEDPAV